MQSGNYIARGARAARAKPGIVVLGWLVQLVIAAIVAIPLMSAMRVLEGTGLGVEMARRFDIAILADMWPELSDALRLTFLNLLWALPLIGILRALMAAGIINAVRDDGLRSFWRGIGDYGLGTLGLAGMWFVLTGIIQAGFLTVVSIAASGAGERVMFMLFVVATPLGFAMIGSLADCMRDYSIIALVSRYQSVAAAFGTGMRWPFENRRALKIYVSWLVAAFFITPLPLLFENVLVGATTTGLILLVLLQQSAMVIRSGVTVAWLGSEVAYFEDRMAAREPLIAMDEAAEPHAAADAAVPVAPRSEDPTA